MPTSHDLIILSVVSALGGAYGVMVAAWLRRVFPSDQPRTEQIGLSLIAGFLVLAVSNNYLSSAWGAKATAVVLILLPLASIVFEVIRRRSIGGFTFGTAVDALRDTSIAWSIAAVVIL